MKTYTYDLKSQIETWNKVNLKLGMSSIGHPDLYHTLSDDTVHKLNGHIHIKIIWDIQKIEQQHPNAFAFLEWCKKVHVLDLWYPILQAIKDLTTPSAIRSIKMHPSGFLMLLEIINKLPYDNKESIYESIYEHYIPHLQLDHIIYALEFIQSKNVTWNILKYLHHEHTDLLTLLTEDISFDRYFFWWHQQNFLTQERHVRMWSQSESLISLFKHPAHFHKREMLTTWLKNHHPDWLNHNDMWKKFKEWPLWDETRVVTLAFYLSLLEDDKLLSIEDQQEWFYPMLASLTHEYEPSLFINKEHILGIIKDSYEPIFNGVQEKYQKIRLQNIDDMKNPRNIDFFEKHFL